MKFAMLIYPDPAGEEALAEGEREAVSAEYLSLRDDPRCLGGAHLRAGDTATTVRAGGGAEGLITDGPFADTKEVLAGYYVIDATDLDGALDFARRIPAVRLGGAVEVRPLFEVPAESVF